MQVEQSSNTQHYHRSLSRSPGNTFPNAPTKSGRHVHFLESGSKSGRSNASSTRGYIENYSHKSSFPRSSGYQSPSISHVFSSSRNSDASGEDSPRSKKYNSRFKVTTGSMTPDSGVASGGSDSKASDPPSTKSENTTPRYKFHSSRHTPESGLLLGDFKTDQKPKIRNADFSFAAKSDVVADEVDDSLENDNTSSTKAKRETTTKITTNHSLDETTGAAFYQKRKQPTSRIAEIVSPESSKKTSDSVKLPPTKQNGHLVHADEPQQTKKSKKTEKHDGRQIADPKRKKKTDEDGDRQAKSAPPKRKEEEDVKDPPNSPQVDNYTHRSGVDTPTNEKKKSTKNQGENKPQVTETKEEKTKTGVTSKPNKGHENDRKEKNKDSEIPTKMPKGQTDKQKSTINSQQHAKFSHGDDGHLSPSNHSPVANDKSRPVTKSNRTEHNGLANSDDKFFSPIPKHEEMLLNEEKREQQIMRLRLPKKTRYGPVRAKGIQTPRTPRSKTPRSRTPRNRIRKTGYSHSDTGDYRSPGRKSILSNRNAVLLENSRPKSYKWESDKSIYRVQTKDWEDQRDDLTWRPSVNSPTDWLRVYVGDIQIREKSAKSRKNSPETTLRYVRPGAPQKNTNHYILTRSQVPVYKNMHSAYNNKLIKDKQSREKRFFQKLQECQALKAQMQISDLVDAQRKRESTKQRQQEQLKEMRQRFEDAAWVRFNTQYVTSRILEHEKMNRYAYGLPEEVDGSPEFESKLKRKPPKIKVDFGKLEKSNKKKYGSMFSIYKGPEWDPLAKTPPMEGIDTVEIDYETDGGTKKVKTRRVKDVIREAEQEVADLKANQTTSAITPRASEPNGKTSNGINLDSDDDDDDDLSDIFERARKKYNLEVDDETVSRSRK